MFGIFEAPLSVSVRPRACPERLSIAAGLRYAIGSIKFEFGKIFMDEHARPSQRVANLIVALVATLAGAAVLHMWWLDCSYYCPKPLGDTRFAHYVPLYILGALTLSESVSWRLWRRLPAPLRGT